MDLFELNFFFSCNCWTFSVTVTVSYWRYLTLIRQFKIKSQFRKARIGFQKSVDVGDKFSSLVTKCRYWWFGFKNVTNIFKLLLIVFIDNISHQHVVVLQHPLSHLWPPIFCDNLLIGNVTDTVQVCLRILFVRIRKWKTGFSNSLMGSWLFMLVPRENDNHLSKQIINELQTNQPLPLWYHHAA